MKQFSNPFIISFFLKFALVFLFHKKQNLGRANEVSKDGGCKPQVAGFKRQVAGHCFTFNNANIRPNTML